MKRTSTAVWKGGLKDGKGTISSKSGVLKNTQYSFSSRFEEGTGTNPEELIAGAHAGCFSMALSAALEKEGYKPENVETSSTVTIENLTITNSHLVVKAKVPGITKEKFDQIANDAEANCPVSKALKLEITMETNLSNNIESP